PAPATLTTRAQAHLRAFEQRAVQSDDAPDRYKVVRSALRQQMWDNVGIVRRTATLRTALEAIHTLADQAHACRGDRPATVVRCLELDNLVLIAEAITLAAFNRQD